MDIAEHFYAKDRAAWRAWLEQYHETEAGVWLVFDKGPARGLKWEEIVQEALCFGWIDGRAGTVSDTQSKLYVSKRKPKGRWSKINKAHIEKLSEDGLMRPAGLAAIERAKLNGSWDTLNNSDNLILPPELKLGFAENPVAQANFEAYPVSTKRFMLQWVYDAKTEATREKRVAKIVESAQRNKKLP